jgi:cytochrome c553
MKTLISTLALILSATGFSVNAAEPHAGEARHNQKCMSCHKTDVYTREDRTVKTMSALSNQVDNCMKGAAKAEWTNKQTKDVIDYLNSKFYKF